MKIKKIRNNTYRKMRWYEEYDEELCMLSGVIFAIVIILVCM